LTDAAYSIRDEYQNWMTAFGHCQPDARIWEAGITATRSPLLSDLFQFAAYMELLRGWMTVKAAAAPACVVIEDPWLWDAVRETIGSHVGVVCHGRVGLAQCRYRLRAAGRALAARLFFAIRALGLQLESRWTLPTEPGGDRPWILIHISIESRSFDESGRLQDPYSGRLRQILEENGERVVWLTHLTLPQAVLRRLKPLASEVLALPRYNTVTEVLMCAARRYHVEIPGTHARFRGWDLTPMLRRETFETRSRTGYMQAALMERAARRSAARVGHRTRALVFAAENQEWEQPLLRAWRAASPSTCLIAHKNYPMRPLLLGEFVPPRPGAAAAAPDTIAVCGDHSRTLLRDCGFPAHMVSLTGGLRFAWAQGQVATPRARGAKSATEARVLVLLPYSLVLGRLAVADLRHQLQLPLTVQPNRRVRFSIKFHPLTGPSQLMRGDRSPLPSHLDYCHDALADALAKTDLALYVPSSSEVWEATAMGVPVLLYRPDALETDCFPPAQMPFPVCARASLRAAVQQCLAELRPAVAQAQAKLAELIAPVDESAWLRAVRGAPLEICDPMVAAAAQPQAAS